MSVATFYVSSGGDVIAVSGGRLTPQDAEALRELYEDEIVAAYRAQNLDAMIRARRHADDLRQAVSACKRWRQASGGVWSER